VPAKLVRTLDEMLRIILIRLLFLYIQKAVC